MLIEVIVAFSRYFDEAIADLLKAAQNHYKDVGKNPLYIRNPIFKSTWLLDVAGEFDYETFLSATLSKRSLAYEWSRVRMQVDSQEVKYCV